MFLNDLLNLFKGTNIDKWFICINYFCFFFWRHQGFGVLSVILANHAIKLLTSLFQDLQVEALHRVNEAKKTLNSAIILKKYSTILTLFKHARKPFCSLKAMFPHSNSSVHQQGWASDGPPAELNIMAQSTSIQRVQRLIDSVPLTNLLFTLLSTSYKKVQSFIYGNEICEIASYVLLLILPSHIVLCCFLRKWTTDQTVQLICQLLARGKPNFHILCDVLRPLLFC